LRPRPEFAAELTAKLGDEHRPSRRSRRRARAASASAPGGPAIVTFPAYAGFQG
jgi:hypothetical protein